MFRSGAMLYAVFICFLISLLFSGLILFGYLNGKEIININQNLLLIKNVESFFNSQNLSDLNLNDSTEIDLYSDETAIVNVKAKQWGLFDIIECRSERKKSKYVKTALVGSEFDFSNEQVLYLCDGRQALSISGKTVIKGNCSLPERGIKTNFIEGTGFTGDKKVEGVISNSKAFLPEINSQELQKRISILDEYAGLINIDNFYNYNPGDSIINSFNNLPLVVHSSEKMKADELYIKGNVIITSDVEVFIGKDTEISDAVIFAPSITVESGFKGTLQLLAIDSVDIQSNCILYFPSVISIYSSKNEELKSLIKVGDKSVFCGTILNFNAKHNFKSQSLVSIGSEAKVYGEVYCSDAIEVKGEFYGSMYCRTLVYISKTGRYENQLLNATLDFYKLPEYFVGIDLFENGNKKVIKWL